ncbi:ornithine carbamoyltransferase [Roseateles sp. P5_D6]
MTEPLNTESDSAGLTLVNGRAFGVDTLPLMCSEARQGAAGATSSYPVDAAAVLRQARVLLRLQASEMKPLTGRRLALMSPHPADDEGSEFAQAATSLGAHVSFVQPGLDEHSSPWRVDATARMLSRLYDAVECQHLPAALTGRLARSADIPVFAGLATAGHPTAVLAQALEGDVAWAVKRRRILQAVLVVSLA